MKKTESEVAMSDLETSGFGTQRIAWAPAIRHPLDRAYQRKIESIPLMPRIMGWVVDHQREELEAAFAGDGILVTEQSVPEAYVAFLDACSALDLNPSLFRLFIFADHDINAFTTGSDIPVVCLTRGLVNACTRRELTFVIGHELGHYICGHVRAQSLARYLVQGIFLTPAWVASAALYPLLMSWQRYAEISADRAGLLACRDFETACSVFLKLGGFPYLKNSPETPSRVLMDQCIAYTESTGRFNMLRRLWREVDYGLSATHPRVVERFTALDEWRDLGYYEEVLDASPEERVRLAKDVDDDYLRNELNLVLVETVADYLEHDRAIPRKTSLHLLRRAFLHGESLRGTALERLVYAELAVSKSGEGDFSYVISLLFADGGTNARKVSITVDYTSSGDFAPQRIRDKFIETRSDVLHIRIYEPTMVKEIR